MMELILPEILNIPQKMLRIITMFNKYRYVLAEGGRNSSKTHSIARFILVACEQRKIRVLCGRETQKSIEESVYTLFRDLILEYGLNFTIQSNKIIHNKTGSTISFKGFREQGSQNIKGVEGIDILWIDEAQSITKATYLILMPTIRKENSKVFFSMNRLFRNDAVYSDMITDPDCLHININYYDNPHTTEVQRKRAEKMKVENYQDYEHIWLGKPRDQVADMLLSYKKLDAAKLVPRKKEGYPSLKVMAVDFSAQGGDLNVAGLIESSSPTQWDLTKKERWSESDTDVTIGKVINIYSRWKPHILIVDGGGMGYPLYNTISKTIPDVIKFDGAGASNLENAGNQRADGYLTLKEFFDNEWLHCSDNDVISQLEYIKRVFKPNGKIYIQSKKDMKEDGLKSPDDADMLMMGIYALNYYSHMFYQSSDYEATCIDSDFDPFG